MYRKLPSFFVLLLALLGSPTTAETQDAEVCRRVTLEQSPTFSYSAAWSVDGQRLFIAAPLDGKIFVYDAEGRFLEHFASPGSGPYAFSRPHGIQTLANGGLVVHDTDDHSIWFDADLQGTRSVQLGSEQFANVQSVSGPSRVWNGVHLVARSNLKLDSQNKTGFARFSIDEEPRSVELVVAFADDPMEVGARYQRMTGPSTAMADSNVYGLVFGSPSRLYRLAPTVQALESFPAGYETLPPLPKTPGNPTGSAMQLKFVQRQTIPVGIYGHGAYLFLLTRDPFRTDDGFKTKWRLHQIDPEADELVRSMTLPTQTEHLMLAPGSRHWALIEKGPVDEVAQHEIDSMLLVPTSWIEDPSDAALREADEGPACNAIP